VSLLILGDSIAVGIGGILRDSATNKTVAKVGASPAAIAAMAFVPADWIIVSAGSNGNDPSGMPALNQALAAIVGKGPNARLIFVLPVKEPARSTVQTFAAAHGCRTITFTASPTDALGVHPADYRPLADQALTIMRAADPQGSQSLTPLQKIVRQWDGLLESLIGGQDIHRAALWGQCLQESAGNPAAEEFPGQNKGGFGLWQHTGSRATELKQFASSLGKPWQDAEAQVRFVGHECQPNGPEAHAWAQIQKTTTIEAATETAMLLYERPATQGGPPTYGTARLDVRIKGAQQALAVITAQQGEGQVTDTSGVSAATPAQAILDKLNNLEQKIEQIGNQVVSAQAPQAAGIISLVESLINPMLPALNAKLGAQIQSNALAVAIVDGLTLVATFFAQRASPTTTV